MRSGAQGAELVVTEPDGREIRSDSLKVPAPLYPSVSRKGNVLVVNSYAVRDRSFWRTGPNGENPVRLTPGPSDFLGHDVAPDGAWVAYTTWASGRFAVWRIRDPPTRKTIVVDLAGVTVAEAAVNAEKNLVNRTCSADSRLFRVLSTPQSIRYLDGEDTAIGAQPAAAGVIVSRRG